MSSLLMALLQEPSFTSNQATWITISLAVIAAAAFVQLIVFAAAGIAAMKAVSEAKALVAEVKGKTLPIIQKTTDIVHDLQPKIQTLSENVVQLTYLVRAKADEVGETVSQVNQTVQQVNQTVAEANLKTRSQVGHVDRMVSTALSSTEDLTKTVVHGINVPIKQVAGVIAGLRVGFETLVKNFSGGAKTSGPSTYYRTDDPLP